MARSDLEPGVYTSARLPYRAWAAALLSAVLAGMVYANALENPFIFDDHRMIVENTAIRSLTNIRAILLHDVTRPVVNVSYAIDYAIWGGGVFGFHLTSVLLHMLNVVLLFVLAWRLACDRCWRPEQEVGKRIQPYVVAVTTGVLLAVHPMMTQATGYISGRPEVLCGTTFLLAFFCARRWMLGGGAGWWLGSVVLWVIALATKEVAAVFPFVILCYDRFVLRGSDEQWQRRLGRLHIPLILIASLAAVLRLGILAFIEHPEETVVRWRFALVEAEVVLRYLALMLLPSGQTIFHAISPINAVFEPRAIFALAAFALLIVIAWRMRSVDGLVTFGYFWFLLLLLPSIALVMLDRGEPMAEHRVYVASMGLFLIAGSCMGWAVASLGVRNRRGLLIVRISFAALLVAFGGLTILRNVIWSNPVTLWLEAASDAPNHWVPRLLLGEALEQVGRREAAVTQYRAAIALRPQEQLAYLKLGGCLADMGRLGEASETFSRLETIDPRSPVASNGLGTVAMLQGDGPRAREYFRRTIERDPSNVPARRLLAAILERSAPEEALRLCHEIRDLAPDTQGNDDCIRRLETRLNGSSSRD